MEAIKIYLIHDDTLDLSSLSELTADYPLIFVQWGDKNTLPENVRARLYLNDEQIKELIPLASEKQWEIGVLTHPDAKYAVRALGVKGDMERFFHHYMQAEVIAADVLTCNGQVVLSSVAIGEVHSLRPYFC